MLPKKKTLFMFRRAFSTGGFAVGVVSGAINKWELFEIKRLKPTFVETWHTYRGARVKSCFQNLEAILFFFSLVTPKSISLAT